jgi:thymidylate kinase
MIFIVEGMDNCGKSTLIENLRKDFFARAKTIIHHSSAPPKSVDFPDLWERKHYDDLFFTFKSLVDWEDYDVILDRFHLGAQVYGAKYRQSEPGPILAIDKAHLTGYNSAATLLLTDSYESIISRDDGKSIETTPEEYEDVRVRFIEAFNKSVCPHKLHIDISRDLTGGMEELLPAVVDWLYEIQWY